MSNDQNRLSQTVKSHQWLKVQLCQKGGASIKFDLDLMHGTGTSDVNMCEFRYTATHSNLNITNHMHTGSHANNCNRFQVVAKQSYCRAVASAVPIRVTTNNK